MLLGPHDAGVPQSVDDGVVHDGVRLAPLALHRLERLQHERPAEAHGCREGHRYICRHKQQWLRHNMVSTRQRPPRACYNGVKECIAVLPASLAKAWPALGGTSGKADLQGKLPLAAALKGRDECSVRDDIRCAALLLHEVKQVARLLPLPACMPQDSSRSPLIR